MSWENRNYAFAEAFVDELARAGLRHACICPGSRSTPLALALAREPRIKKWIHLDERSAAFFALGTARALGEPVAVLCTSGTAAANFLPAMVEASYSSTPLIAVTADRPPELQEWGAPQTIDQTRLYGTHAKWSTTVQAPELVPHLLRFVRATANRLFSMAVESPSGPVHVNVQLREPLTPELVPEDRRAMDAFNDLEALQGRANKRSFSGVSLGSNHLDGEEVARLAGELSGTERGVIICGWQHSAEFPALVTELASRLGYPLLADPLSQVRAGAHDLAGVIDNHDLFLREPRLLESLSPEVVIRFGALPTSKALTQFMEKHWGARQVLAGMDGWSDPSHLGTDMLRAEANAVCRALLEKLPQGGRRTGWLDRWLSLRDLAHEALQEQLGGMEELFEGKVFAELAELLPDEAVLFAGNSMPVRDMDSFLPPTAKRIQCAANRGASGIDGVVSTALGYSAAQAGRTVLVVGDISFYHDMNGLLAARRYGLDTTIVVVNNDGGGIFSFLPQAAYPEHFEELLGTPHGLEFGPAAQLYDLPYTKVGSWGEFRAAVGDSFSRHGTTVIELPGDRARNVRLHQQVTEAVLAKVAQGVAE